MPPDTLVSSSPSLSVPGSEHSNRQVKPAQPLGQHLGREAGGGMWSLAGATKVADPRAQTLRPSLVLF